jgi:hypothetical protein
MFYQVRVLDREGNVKKVLSSKELSRHYWHDFENRLHGQTPPPPIKGKGRKGLRKQKMPMKSMKMASHGSPRY